MAITKCWPDRHFHAYADRVGDQASLAAKLLTIRRRSAWALSAIAPAVVGGIVATSVQAVAVACLSLRFAVSQGAYSSVPSAVRLVELHP